VVLVAEAGCPSPRDTQARTAANVVNAAMIPIRTASSNADITLSKPTAPDATPTVSLNAKAVELMWINERSIG
jgi:hypothetical protein